MWRQEFIFADKNLERTGFDDKIHRRIKGNNNKGKDGIDS